VRTSLPLRVIVLLYHTSMVTTLKKMYIFNSLGGIEIDDKPYNQSDTACLRC
jgi:hypothetical protein